MSEKKIQQTFQHKYRARHGVFEMHVNVISENPFWSDVINMENASNSLQSIQDEASITGYFKEALHQPIFLN